MTHVLRLTLRSSWPAVLPVFVAVCSFLLPTSAAAGPDRAKTVSWPSGAGVAPAAGVAAELGADVLQTRDGYFWLGTKGGVSRFDGVRFTTFDDRDKTQLRESEVWALAEGA